jgi:hypothetical protein
MASLRMDNPFLSSPDNWQDQVNSRPLFPDWKDEALT